MTKWRKQNSFYARNAGWQCPWCKAEWKFESKVELPELWRCQCGVIICLIKGPDKEKES